MDDRFVGTWVSELMGTSLARMEPVTSRSRQTMTLRADGTASSYFGPTPNTDEEDEWPFPMTWETTEDGVLYLWVPIAPMPEFDMPEWTRDAMHYAVLSVGEATMTLSTRPFDGEAIIRFRRMTEP